MSVQLYTLGWMVVAIVLSYVLTMAVRKITLHWQLLDRPGERKIQKHAMPTMGGIAIFITFWLVYLLGYPFEYPMTPALFLASFVVLVTGIIDDLKELKPWQKSLGILVAACIVYFFANIRIVTMTLPFVGLVSLKFSSLLVTVGWIFIITNAVNLMDGLDGLASGLSLIAIGTMSVLSYWLSPNSRLVVIGALLLLFSAILGFLPHNLHPAKIYLGDTGALFIGFMIAVFSLNNLKNATFFTMIIPFAILGVPITDTIAAVIRRVAKFESIGKGDRLHLHHRLLRLGFSHRQTVYVIYALALIFSLTAIIYPFSSLVGTVLLIVGFIFGIVLFIVSTKKIEQIEQKQAQQWQQSSDAKRNSSDVNKQEKHPNE